MEKSHKEKYIELERRIALYKKMTRFGAILIAVGLIGLAALLVLLKITING